MMLFLRSFEKISGCEAIRPDIAGIMGAFGAALIARERYHGEANQQCFLSTQLTSLIYSNNNDTMQGLYQQLHALLLINSIGGRRFISGNRCEKGLGKEKNKDNIPNLFEYKFHRMFDYEPLSEENAKPRNCRNSTCT